MVIFQGMGEDVFGVRSFGMDGRFLGDLYVNGWRGFIGEGDIVYGRNVGVPGVEALFNGVDLGLCPLVCLFGGPIATEVGVGEGVQGLLLSWDRCFFGVDFARAIFGWNLVVFFVSLGGRDPVMADGKVNSWIGLLYGEGRSVKQSDQNWGR